MKKFSPVLMVVFLAGCTCDENAADLQFSKKHHTLYQSYTQSSQKDTIYFLSNRNDWDTLLVASVDSAIACGGLMAARGKQVSVEITHLPYNHWNGGFEGRNGKPFKLNQRLIVIEKLAEEKLFIGFNYRNFMGEITDLNIMRSDSMLLNVGVAKYWEIYNNASEWPQYRQDSTLIMKVLWSENFGLTGYMKRSGEFYKIRSGL